MSLSKSRYVASLDGLRSFAVLAVIAYHMGYAWAPGGLLGVTVFFVLSGYLITGLLLSEFRSSKTIDLPRFWLRRIRRLVPAIVTVVIVTCALCVLFNHILLTKMRPDIIPSLLFYSNWWQIFHDVSYFEAQGSPSPLQHFWSLAIEEQFYLVWPVLLLPLLKRRTSFKTLKRAILIAAAGSALLMAVLYTPDGDPSRAYFGTDTRAFSLLIGAWLAFVWPSTAFGEPQAKTSLAANVSPKAVRTLDIIGVLAFAGIVALVALTNGYTAFPYRGGILLCSILTAVVIATLTHPASVFAKLWALFPLVWIGKRSYGMYLWHFPILLLMTDPNTTQAAPWWWNVLELAIIFAVSAFSYTFIEDPIRKGKLGAWVREVKSGSINVSRSIARFAVPGLACCAVFAVAAIGGIVVPPVSAVEGADTPTTDVADAAEHTQQSAQAAADNQTVYDVLMIGDSVSARCENIFPDYFPDGYLDAVVGRPMTQGQETYARYSELGVVGDDVVIALGTNNLVTEEQLESFIADIGSNKNIWLVNTRSDHEWMDDSNKALAQAAERHDNVHLIDWFSYSSGNDDFFTGDSTHLTLDAANKYLSLIKDNIEGTA